MRNAWGKEKHIPLANRNISKCTGLPHPEDHIAFELVEKFLAGIDVEILATVRPRDDGHKELAIGPNLSIPNGRLQRGMMLVDPTLQIKRLHFFQVLHIFSVGCRVEPNVRLFGVCTCVNDGLFRYLAR